MIKRERLISFSLLFYIILYYLIMNKEIKENLTGLMVTLGTDTERKFAWCLRKINNRPFICIHKRKDGYSKFNENDFITAFPIDVIEDCLKLLL